MPDATGQSQVGQTSSDLTIPQEIAEKFAEVILLIKRSESMQNEERQYWINTLPTMTPDQVNSLRDILQNEQRQLAAIDAKYAAKQTQHAPEIPIEEIDRKRKQERSKRAASEMSDSKQEEEKEQELLKLIENA